MVTEEIILASCGGRKMTEGGESGWWFGANPSRPEDTEKVVTAFDPSEKVLLTGPRVMLGDFNKRLNGGVHPAYSWQQTGSCVQSGCWNATYMLNGILCSLATIPVAFARPFCFHAYAYSRYIMFGRDAEGEGSSGDGIARAMGELGSSEWDAAALTGVVPRYKVYGPGLTIEAAEELHWSKWSNVPGSVKEASKPNPLQYVAVKTLDQAEAELRKGRPLSWAGNWGSSMQMRYRGTGANKVLWGEHAGRWDHQQMVCGVWHNPELGRIWNVLNNWYFSPSGRPASGDVVPVHGAPASDEIPGSYWIDDTSMQYQLNYRFGEVRSYKSMVGYDEGKLSYLGI